MSAPVIRVEGIGKKYRIGVRSQGYPTIRDTLVNAFTSPLRRADRWLRRQPPEAQYDTFWALKDVSFDVCHGEVMGIVGRNGAGKSTMLKILSRITEPTEGRAQIQGRVRALLEVGTGFHPELTGRENIFLNGAILGMPRAEIKRKFDEIVAFSEIEKFLDTPVKHYSSGMFVRLAFAVAAHLEPEILIIDEVLSVGDVAFQKKCLGKIGEVSRGGRTVVFVTHNMAAALHNCQKGILLENGRITQSGSMQQVVDSYLSCVATRSEVDSSSAVDLTSAPGRPEGLKPLLKRLELFNGKGELLNGPVAVGAPLKVRIHFMLEQPSSQLDIGLGVNSALGQRVFTAYTTFDPRWNRSASPGQYIVECEIPSLGLAPGEYRIKVFMDFGRKDESQDFVEDAIWLSVVGSDYYGTGNLPWSGVCVMPHRWALEMASSLVEEA
jgi:lipopolysaccharide transport system ATP-binding protein